MEKNNILTLNNSTKFKNAPIGKWASNQINLYKENNLPKDKIKKLEMLNNWIWEVDKRNIVWDMNFNELKKYSNKFKTSNVPKNYISNNLELGKWTDRQRAYYGNKRAALTKERIKKLESLKYWSWSKKNTSK